MTYQAIATDFDGTIATGGKVAQGTYLALQRWQQTGRSLIMVTGRGLDSLYGVFPEMRKAFHYFFGKIKVLAGQ